MNFKKYKKTPVNLFHGCFYNVLNITIFNNSSYNFMVSKLMPTNLSSNLYIIT